jgi:hypothetical protein
MSAGFLVNQNCTSVAFPKLSVNGIPIGARRKADSLSYTSTNRHPLDNSFQYRELWQHTLQVNDLYSSPARAIYLRPRAMSVDIYC